MGRWIGTVVLALVFTACPSQDEGTTEPSVGGQWEPGAGQEALEDGEEAALQVSPGLPVQSPAGTSGLARVPATPRSTGAAVQMKELERHPGSTPALPHGEAKWEFRDPEFAGTPGVSPAVGPANAPVKAFVFSDFQCPVCKRVVEPLKAVVREFPQTLQVIFVHNALTSHARAEGAARAAIAAHRQGRFWEYHDHLFKNQSGLSERQLVGYASQLGLDVERFEADMRAPSVQEQVNYERALSESLGVRGTPGFFINGQKMVGWASYSGFRGMVKRALKRANGLAADGGEATGLARRATREQGEDGAMFAARVWGVK